MPYLLVCQRCWQSNYIGLYVSVADKQCHICLYASVAGKQAIWACMSALLASKILWLVCQRCWQASYMWLVCQRCWQARYCGLYAGKQAICACMHTYHQNIIQTSVVVLSSICTHTYIYIYVYIYIRTNAYLLILLHSICKYSFMILFNNIFTYIYISCTCL